MDHEHPSSSFPPPPARAPQPGLYAPLGADLAIPFDENDGAVEPELTFDRAPVPVTPIRRFCTSCGTPLTQYGDCPRCTAIAFAPAPVIPSSPGTVSSALGLFFALLAGSVIVLLAIRGGSDPIKSMLVLTAFDAVLVAIWCLADQREIAPLLKRTGSAHWYIIAVLGAGLTFGLASLVVTLVRSAFDLPSEDIALEMRQSGCTWTVIILAVCVQPAIFEELAFRGIILAGAQRIMSTRDAIWVSALLFVIIHLALLAFPHLLVIGLALAYMRFKSGSLYPGMVLHFTHNFLAVVL